MIKCYDVAEIVINQATKEIEDGWRFSPGRMDNIHRICDGIDELLSGRCDNSYGIDVDVDIDTKEIIIGVEFDMCEFKENDPVYTFLRGANDITISASKENPPAIRMEMRFDGVWIS